MTIDFNDWEYHKNTLKPIFGNRKNWYRFCIIMQRLRMKIMLGVTMSR